MDRCGIVVDRCGSLWIVVDHCGIVVGSLWVVVDRCRSLWIVVDHCGSLWVAITTAIASLHAKVIDGNFFVGK